MSFVKRACKDLFVSEPDPSWFGNPPNSALNKAWTNKNWLRSRFHFSFAEYRDSKHSSFGALRVLNDDLVQPARGFGTHPHANMEIVTFIVSGSLTHKDSMGTAETLGRGAIQYMTAGTGVRHSEHNLDPNQPLRFIQIWINPNKSQLKPNYGSYTAEARARLNQWSHLVGQTGTKVAAPIKINQDANLFVTELAAGKQVEFAVGPKRQAYFLTIEGDVRVAGEHGENALSEGDAAEIQGPNPLVVACSKTAKRPALCLMIEMAA
eukprot:gb/GEZN01012415.1/.p1 GENE.gb/GEZN01012415.1/~~gb/GEZN01012415.1/.p1  ORF type:complete len:265 (+),score=36.15 gb/GEZN01012415.1/:117-911(+)